MIQGFHRWLPRYLYKKKRHKFWRRKKLGDLFHETGLDVDMLPEIEALGYATKDPEEFERVYDELEDWRYTRRTEVTFPTYVEA